MKFGLTKAAGRICLDRRRRRTTPRRSCEDRSNGPRAKERSARRSMDGRRLDGRGAWMASEASSMEADQGRQSLN